jgi:hypothetical protein
LAHVVLTSHVSGAAAQAYDDAGCDRFLLKPCMPDALGLEIRDVLASRHVSTTSSGLLKWRQ